MDYVEMYYNNSWGHYPFENEENKAKSQCIIDYLMEAGVAEKDIFKFVENAPKEGYLSPSILPEELWENSLLKKGVFYYHNTLHIRSDAPVWSPITGVQTSSKFYLEMKIRFTLDDLLKYYYRTYLVDPELMDGNKDPGSFKFLLAKYKKFSFIEPVDFILSLIDYGKNQEERQINNVLDIAHFEKQVFDMLKAKVAQARLDKADLIIWRCDY